MTYTQPTIDFSSPAMREWERLSEDIRAEVIHGRLYILSTPTIYHSLLSFQIMFELGKHVVSNKLGLIFDSHVGVYLKRGTNVVCPDVVFVSNDNTLIIIDRKGLYGAPDLHVEVLSPGTRKRDLTIKKKLYEEAGVREYWLVDPDTKNSQGYLLKEGKYGDPLLMNSEIYIRILKKIIRF